jgi:hypothetical protein
MKTKAPIFLLCLLVFTDASAAPDARLSPGTIAEVEQTGDSSGDPVRPARPATRMLTRLPEELESLIVNDHRDLDERLPELAPNQATSFRFEYKSQQTSYQMTPGPFVVYQYRQWIHDVATERMVEFYVDVSTRRLAHVYGTIRMDSDIPVDPKMDEETAVATAVAHIRNGGERARYDVRIDHSAPSETMKYLRDGVLWWGVAFPLEARAYDGATQEWFWVDPEAEVSPYMLEVTFE